MALLLRLPHGSLTDQESDSSRIEPKGKRKSTDCNPNPNRRTTAPFGVDCDDGANHKGKHGRQDSHHEVVNRPFQFSLGASAGRIRQVRQSLDLQIRDSAFNDNVIWAARQDEMQLQHVFRVHQERLYSHISVRAFNLNIETGRPVAAASCIGDRARSLRRNDQIGLECVSGHGAVPGVDEPNDH